MRGRRVGWVGFERTATICPIWSGSCKSEIRHLRRGIGLNIFLVAFLSPLINTALEGGCCWSCFHKACMALKALMSSSSPGRKKRMMRPGVKRSIASAASCPVPEQTVCNPISFKVLISCSPSPLGLMIKQGRLVFGSNNPIDIAPCCVGTLLAVDITCLWFGFGFLKLKTIFLVLLLLVVGEEKRFSLCGLS